MCDQTSIYIHIPFCVKKCVYCDFYSKTDLSLIPGYINALQKEIEKRSGLKDAIDTIYFGGGTPSLLSAKEVETLLQTIGDCFSVASDVEVTFEVNPGTVDLNYFRELKNVGINRLSIGVQSFDDDKLKFLNRIHTAGQARNAIDYAGKAGFDNISMDLIYGIPFETKTAWLKDLKTAVTLMPPHLSCYMLTIESGTPLHEQLKKGVIRPLGTSDMTVLFKQTSQFLGEAGYDHYEISNFSKGRQNRSKHNSKYWDMIPYYGFGAAAHSYDKKTRSWNYRSIDAYIKDICSGRLPVEDRETLTSRQTMIEMIMLRLRTLEGLDLKKFTTLFCVSFETRFKDILDHILESSFGSVKDGRFALTLEGRAHLDSIVEAFAEKIL
ncbi:radical SAM family heme chaperone HemW [Desulfobacula phenolica]|uniref:Heme chaperone HemW n=1 Tax=Desulfobacula phenolica TaxID=90732 RepID=A0A1H2DMV5_9BACT|nr:radical SAM family heme chaperone HemW [Desulfobacula phenolica]SDT84253.1 oxygen-independent coproporphyrinogen-3 oxidase [Desulfobacula phenolica]